MAQHITPGDLVDVFDAGAAEASAIADGMSVYNFEFEAFDQIARNPLLPVITLAIPDL